MNTISLSSRINVICDDFDDLWWISFASPGPGWSENITRLRDGWWGRDPGPMVVTVDFLSLSLWCLTPAPGPGHVTPEWAEPEEGGAPGAQPDLVRPSEPPGFSQHQSRSTCSVSCFLLNYVLCQQKDRGGGRRREVKIINNIAIMRACSWW